MALADTAELAVKLSLDDSQFGKAVNRIDKRLGAFSGAVNRNLGRAVDNAATYAVRGLVGAFNGGINSLRELNTVTAQTEAVVKSTGAAAGVSAGQVRLLAEKYEDLNAQFDDKAIQDAENRLLTFTKIGKKAFEPALQAVLDFAQATGTDATVAAKLLGRALNDPVKGMTQLGRAGVVLDEKTQARIKNLAKQGKLYEAQKILLDELTKRYGGSFAAAGKTAEGSQARLADKVEDVQKAFAQKLLPVVVKISDRLSNYLARPETLAFFDKLGDTISGLFTDENLDALASGIETAAKAVTLAISAFNSLPPEIKALAIGAFAVNKVTGGAVGGIASAFGKVLGAGLSKIFAANVTVIGGSVTGGGGAAGAAGAAGSVGKVGRIANAVKVLGAVSIAGASIAALAETFVSVNDQSSQIAASIKESLDAGIEVKTGPELQAALDGVRQGINDISSNPLNVLVSGDALNTLHSMEGDLQTKLSEINRTTGAGDERITSRIASMNESVKSHASRIAADVRHAGATTSGKLADANAKLDAIRHKRTHFTTNTYVNVKTSVSVSEIQRQARYSSRVARTTSLSAS